MEHQSEAEYADPCGYIGDHRRPDRRPPREKLPGRFRVGCPPRAEVPERQRGGREEQYCLRYGHQDPSRKVLQGVDHPLRLPAKGQLMIEPQTGARCGSSGH